MFGTPILIHREQRTDFLLGSVQNRGERDKRVIQRVVVVVNMWCVVGVKVVMGLTQRPVRRKDVPLLLPCLSRNALSFTF